MREQLISLLPENIILIWDRMTNEVDNLYDMEKTRNKGFGDWVVEYKYRRGGKTLCTFYAKKGTANLLITYGKAEREKFEVVKDSFPPFLQKLYDDTETLHDGKWLWIPLDENLKPEDLTAMLKIKRRPNRKEP